MSKVDAMRAMREARHARATVRPAEPVGPGEPVVRDELCGHRNMGGKSCSRPAGHREKNHRYATA
jgi:hypothetical protein